MSSSVIAEYRRGVRGRRPTRHHDGRTLLVIDDASRERRTTRAVTSPSGRMACSTSGIGDGGGLGDPSDNGQRLSSPLAQAPPHRPPRPRRSRAQAIHRACGQPVRRADRASTSFGATACDSHGGSPSTAVRGDLWIGDVGENDREEVIRARARRSGTGAGKGRNDGWSRCEGSLAVKPRSRPALHGRTPSAPRIRSRRRLVLGHRRVRPSGADTHASGGGSTSRATGAAESSSSIARVPSELRRSRPVRITSFGEDAAGRQFATGDGRLYEVQAASVRDPEPRLRARGELARPGRMRGCTGFADCAPSPT